jgi:hypothetical protein
MKEFLDYVEDILDALELRIGDLRLFAGALRFAMDSIRQGVRMSRRRG